MLRNDLRNYTCERELPDSPYSELFSDRSRPRPWRPWPPMLGLRRGRHAARHEPRVAAGADQADGAARDRRPGAAAQQPQDVVVLVEVIATAGKSIFMYRI